MIPVKGVLWLALAAACAMPRGAMASDESEERLAGLLERARLAQTGTAGGSGAAGWASANQGEQGVPVISETKELLPPSPEDLPKALRWHQILAQGSTPGARAYETCGKSSRMFPKDSPRWRKWEAGCLELHYIRDLATIPETEAYYSSNEEGIRLTERGRRLAMIALDEALERLLAGGHQQSPSRAHYESRCAGADGEKKSLCMQHAYGLLLKTIDGGNRYYLETLFNPGETSLGLTALGQMFVRIHRLEGNARIRNVSTVPGSLDTPHTQRIQAARDACLNTYGSLESRDRLRMELESLLQACGGAQPCELETLRSWAGQYGCESPR